MTIRILQGDCLDLLRSLPNASVQCCVTSPPYWGLRDYGLPSSIWGGDTACEHEWGADSVVRRAKLHALSNERNNGAFCQQCNAWRGCLGLEPTPKLFISNLVLVFREVWRVLRQDGVAWVNLGDTYANVRPGGRDGDRWPKQARNDHKPSKRRGWGDAKQKDLIGVPWMAAFALRDDGWWLRRDQIWSKPNGMPESVTDRPTTSHEYVFLLTKAEDYFFDAEAIAEPVAESSIDRVSQDGLAEQAGSSRANGGRKTNGAMKAVGGTSTRNSRSVWTISPQPFKGSHFATMPPLLAEKCIRSGSSEVGCCPACRAPWERVLIKGEPNEAWRKASGADTSGSYAGQSTKGHDAAGVQNASDVKRRILEGMREKITIAWQMTCECPMAKPIPCTALDPFGGAGTTGMVADRLGRDAVLIELNPEYVAMATCRLQADGGLFAEVKSTAA